MRIKAVLLGLSLIAFFSTTSQAQFIPKSEAYLKEPNSEPREHPLDIQHLRVEVSFDAPKGLVKGKVTHSFVPLRKNVDSIFFDGPSIRIQQATLNGRPLKFTTTDAGVSVFPNPPLNWGEHDSITFTYEANPRRGLYFVGWNDPRNMTRKQIWTQGQGIDNRHWVPLYDEMNDKTITETIITFDKDYQVLSNGTRLGVKENADGTKTWHYTMTHRHAPYLMMIGIGKYAIDDRMTKGGVPVHLYYYPEHPEQREPTYRYSTEEIDFVADQTGVPYPWESYSQIPVSDFIFGAMENTTATVFGDFFLVDPRAFHDRNYIGVNVHELTHQWFGDDITARSSKGAWLQESFATFYPKMFTRKYFGEEAYEWNRRGEQNSALTASETDLFPIVHNRAGTSRIYPKGSAVIDMMQYVVGEDEFKHVINHYLKHHAYSNVETNDLYLAFQDTLGLTMDWFFDEWLYRGGEPVYDISYQQLGTGTEITVSQTHETNDLVKLFKMPVVFEVHYTDGTSDRTRQWVEKQTERVVVANPSHKQVEFVLFDPGSYIIKKINFKRSYDELAAQALKAPNMIDRYDAVAALKLDSSRSMSEKRALYAKIFDKETYHAVKGEIVSQLANDSSDDARAIVRKAVHDKMDEVRTAALNNIKLIPEALRVDFESLLADSSYNIERDALEKLSEAFPQNVQRYLDQTKNDYGISNRVKAKWLEIAAQHGDVAARKQLVDYVSNSYEFGTRQAAMLSLRKLGYLDEELAHNLIDAMLSHNGRLAGSANDLASYLMQQSGNRAIFFKLYRAGNWSQQDREVLEKTIK